MALVVHLGLARRQTAQGEGSVLAACGAAPTLPLPCFVAGTPRAGETAHARAWRDVAPMRGPGGAPGVGRA